MRTRPSNYGSVAYSFHKDTRRLQRIHQEDEKHERVHLLDPHRYPLHIGNKLKIANIRVKDDITKSSQSSVLNNACSSALADASRTRWVSGLTLILYHVSCAPLVTLVTQYLLQHTLLTLTPQNVTMTTTTTTTTTWNPVNGLPCDMIKGEEWRQEHSALHSEVHDHLDNFQCSLAVAAIFSSLLLGSYCDVVGRKPIVIIALTGSLIQIFLLIQVMRFNLQIEVFYIVFAIGGLTGSSFVLFTALFSIVADINQDKTGRVAWIASLIGLDFLTVAMVTFFVTKYLIPAVGNLVTSCLLLLPLFAAILIVVCLLPETLPKPKDTSLSPLKRLSRVFKIYTSEGTWAKHVTLFLALLILSLLEVNVMGPLTIDTLYLSHKPFCWDFDDIRVYSTARLAGQSVLAVVSLILVYGSGCVSGENMAVAGTLFQGGSFVLQAMANSSWIMILVPIIGFPGFVCVPIVEAAMSFLVSKHDQGALFAGIAAKKALSNVIGFTSLGRVYTNTVDVTRGAIYLIMASISILSFILFFPFFFLHHRVSNKEIRVPLDESHDLEDANGTKT